MPTPCDNTELEALMANEPALLVLDVRNGWECAELGMIDGALNIPIQQLQARLTELDPERPTVVICEHGVRSQHACAFLEAQGFKTLYNHTHGMSDWDGPRVFP